MASIRVLENGPYLVEGADVVAVDAQGAPLRVAARPFALCRCGASAKKPFCDGSHTRIGFTASSRSSTTAGRDEPEGV
jgi:CDGSH-type Zn-finger protein